MTVEELLKPRYKVVADYPDSDYEVGEVVHIIHEGGTLHSVNENGSLLEFNDFYLAFPHIFKPLAWYENRDVKDMPEYLVADQSFYGVENYNLQDGRVSLNMNGAYFTDFIEKYQPTTEQEYIEYINKNTQP